MTIPPSLAKAAETVADYVRNLKPFTRNQLTPDEQDLGAILRGNQKLHDALWGVIQGRIEGRAKREVPSDPIECKGMMERDKELQWLMGRLEFLYRSPPTQEEEGEPPAA